MGLYDRVPEAVGVERSPLRYYLVAGLNTLIFAGLWAFEGYYLFTAWVPELYDEVTPINGVMAGAFMSLMLVCAVVSLLAPRRYAGTGQVLLIGGFVLGATMALSFIQSDPLVMVGLLAVTAILLGLFVWAHPATDTIVPRRAGDLGVGILSLTVLIAVPFVWLGGEFLIDQITLDDDIADRWFYGGYAMYLFGAIALGLVAGIDRRYRACVTLAAAFLVGMLGLVSVVYPTELHSLELVGGVLLLAWTAMALAWVMRVGTASVDSVVASE